MTTFQWSDRFLTGDVEIDHQHKNLFQLANSLSENMNQGEGMRLMTEILFDQLTDYTTYHFGTEEALMAQLKYPELAAHKAMHDKLRDQVVDFRQKFRDGKVEISDALMVFLRDWLFNHIEKVDTKLAQFIDKTDQNRLKL